MSLGELRKFYREMLLDDVIPFWTRHAIDADGGLNSCLTDDGRVISRDRWAWSQWRAVWVFSKLYNGVEPRREWVGIAEGICDFALSHGPVEGGHWPMLVSGDGQIKRGFESIYADGFAIYGLTELWRASRRRELIELASATFRATEKSLRGDEPPPAWPYPIPAGRMAQGISMLFSLVYHELWEATGDVAVRAAAMEHHRRVMEVFLRRDRGVVLEWLDRDGNELPPPEGTVVIPGHAIESMWFQMHIARSHGDRPAMDRAVEAIRRHLDIGWDEEHGGLLLAVDADGGSEVAWPYHDTKLWWPHTEALYATLLAYEHCRENWCLDWHERIREYSLSHYPVREYGEWRQKLDRQGRPLTDVVALPVKDPFHLPRALMYCVEVLERLES